MSTVYGRPPADPELDVWLGDFPLELPASLEGPAHNFPVTAGNLSMSCIVGASGEISGQKHATKNTKSEGEGDKMRLRRRKPHI